MGLAPNTVARWERGDLTIGSPTLVGLALDQLANRRDPVTEPESKPRVSRQPVPRLSEPLIGRDRERADLVALLNQPQERLVTLTGPGGTGKTSLALAVIAELRSGAARDIVFVELAPVRDPTLVLTTVARSIGLQESPAKSLGDTLRDHLAEQNILLVLDNCEHLLNAVQDLVTLLSNCERLTVLATSREPLRLKRERRYPVSPLPTRASGGAGWHAVARAPAVVLFERRARGVQPNFAVDQRNAAIVAQICVRLDGLPLAIELAAARVAMFPPAEILERLRSRLDFLLGGPRDAPQRHQTLRAAIDWSHTLLSESEQMLFRRLTVFSGGANLAGIEAVCSEEGSAADEVTDLLNALVNKSLVQTTATESPSVGRYGLLDTLREYGLEQLEASGEASKLRDRHFLWHLEAAEQIEDELWGPDQEWWFGWLELEHDNFRAALDWGQKRAPTEALRLASALGRFWFMRGYLAEGADRLSTAIEAAPAPTPTRARALGAAACIAYLRGALAELRLYADEALSLAQLHDDRYALGLALLATAAGTHAEGHPDLAEPYALRCMEVASKQGVNVLAAYGRYVLAEITWFLGRTEEAVALMQQTLDQLVELRENFISGIIRARLSHLMLLQMDVDRAVALQRDNLAARWNRGDRFGVAESLCGLAWAASRVGAAEQAAVWFGAAESLWKATGGALPHEYADEQHQALQTAREALGDDAFATAWERGRDTPLDEVVSRALVPTPLAGARARTTTTTVAEKPLSQREQAVAALVGQGMSNAAIARALVISERTAETHVEHIRRKLDCTSRAEIALWAEGAGLLARPDASNATAQ
jgi:non-specific serine/threonine protein kinase